MSARDELAKVIESGYGDDPTDCPYDHAPVIADAVLAAGYRKPRTITTAQELDALAVGSVVLNRGRSFQRYEPRRVGPFTYYMWMSPDGGFVRSQGAGFLILPATVLWEPEVEA